MKKTTTILLALAALAMPALAGTETYSNKNTQSVSTECPQWYADNEFNLTLSGAYAFTANSYRNDQYLGVDHAWGGSIDAKYFFHRYFGLGVQGTLLSVNGRDFSDDGFFRIDGNEDRHAVGTALGTFTLRFPITCSRFAPYVWGGGGGIFGGGHNHDFVLDSTAPLGVIRREFHESNAKTMAQVGAGFEVRITPHIGWTNDFSWNIVSGSHNNFGMARTGVNFAF